MELLIDADFIVYKNCAAAETEIDFGEDVIPVSYTHLTLPTIYSV